ncbi:MAG: sigma-70 family RNA polymerase sigma factor [Planctomycetota bacterium]
MNGPPTTRASLIGRLVDPGDVAAWRQLVEIYGPLVYRIARQKGLQPADADDLVQEVLASVAQSVEGWIRRPDRGRFRSWLFCIARNSAINLLTRPRYRPLAAGGGMAVETLERVAVGEAEAIEMEYQRQVFRWAAGEVRQHVTEATWEAFWKTSVEGESVSAIAQKLEMSVGAIYIARSRVMTKIRSTIATLEEDQVDE